MRVTAGITEVASFVAVVTMGAMTWVRVLYPAYRPRIKVPWPVTPPLSHLSLSESEALVVYSLLRYAEVSQCPYDCGHHGGRTADEKPGILRMGDIFLQHLYPYVSPLARPIRLSCHHMYYLYRGHLRSHLLQFSSAGDILFRFVAPKEGNVLLQSVVIYVSQHAQEGRDANTTGDEDQITGIVVEERGGLQRKRCRGWPD